MIKYLQNEKVLDLTDFVEIRFRAALSSFEHECPLDHGIVCNDSKSYYGKTDGCMGCYNLDHEEDDTPFCTKDPHRISFYRNVVTENWCR